jgi:hypothetical protein
MNISEMHYDFDIKFDKVDSLQQRNFNQAQKDWLLNEAQWVTLKTNYNLNDLNNRGRIGFEMTEQRIQDLKNLHIKSPAPQPAVLATSISSELYEIDLSGLLYEYLFVTRIQAQITKGECTKIVSVGITQTDDLNNALSDPFNRPEFNTGDILGVYGRSTQNTTTQNNPYGAGSLYVYTDGTFTVDSIFIEYIKYPNRLWIGTYDITSNLLPKDGSNTYIYQSGVDTPVSSDLSSHLHNEIVDVAVFLASQIIEDPNYVKLSQQKLIINK